MTVLPLLPVPLPFETSLDGDLCPGWAVSGGEAVEDVLVVRCAASEVDVRFGHGVIVRWGTDTKWPRWYEPAGPLVKLSEDSSQKVFGSTFLWLLVEVGAMSYLDRFN